MYFENLTKRPMPEGFLREQLEQLVGKGWQLPQHNYAVMLQCDSESAAVYSVRGCDVTEVLALAAAQHRQNGFRLLPGSTVRIVGICSNPECPCVGKMGIEVSMVVNGMARPSGLVH